MYFLGIDAGGTHCRARLTDASGCIVGSGVSGPANVRIGVANVFSVLQGCYEQAIAEANLDEKAIATIRTTIGIAGIERPGAKKEMLAQPFPFHSTVLYNDGYIANVGAHSGRDGGIVIVGTGSIAIGRVKGENIRMGGYGFPASDEGSGAYIGLRAIGMTLRAADGRIAHSDLTKMLLKKFNQDPLAIVDWMDTVSATDYAALTPLVMQAAEDGDAIGRDIAQRAAMHIELMVRSLYASGAPRCSLMGGLSERIQPWLSPDIREKLMEPEGNSLDGALWLSRQEDNIL